MKKHEQNKVADFIESHDVYLFGPMGVGKTTLVKNIEEVCDVNYVSMGEITRRAVQDGDPQITQAIRQGGKLSLDVVQNMVSPYIVAESAYVLDGVPRHPDEAEWVRGHATERSFGAIALTLCADDETVLERIAARSSNDNSRSETPDRVAARLTVYRSNYDAIIRTLRPALQDIIHLDTSGLSPREVFNEFYEKV